MGIKVSLPREEVSEERVLIGDQRRLVVGLGLRIVLQSEGSHLLWS